MGKTMQARPRACIIGAGCSGFTTAKALKDQGIPFDIYEKSDVIGGNWVFKNTNGMSACYESLHIDTSKHRMAFADYPIPENFPDFPHHSQVLQYMNDYVDHFDLRPLIQFQTEVRRVEPLSDGTFKVDLLYKDGREETKLYDCVFVCNGHHWCARTPEFPGQDVFQGVQMHSHEYLSPFEPHDLRGKNVIVLGMGNSAMDIASELSQKPLAKSLYLAARRGVWIFPKYINGEPADKNPAPAWMPSWLKRRLGAHIMKKLLGSMENYGLPKPDHEPLEAHPSVSGEILTRLGCGDIIPKPNIKELREREVEFTDGSVVEADAIIYATGYDVRFPFLDEEAVGLKDNHIKLFKRVVRPDVPGLFFMGLAQPLPTLINFAEQQAKWMAAYLSGSYRLPGDNEMWRIIDKDEAHFLGHFYQSRRHTMQLDFDEYCRDLRREWRRGAKRAQAKGMDPRLSTRIGASSAVPETADAA